MTYNPNYSQFPPTKLPQGACGFPIVMIKISLDLDLLVEYCELKTKTMNFNNINQYFINGVSGKGHTNAICLPCSCNCSI